MCGEDSNFVCGGKRSRSAGVDARRKKKKKKRTTWDRFGTVAVGVPAVLVKLNYFARGGSFLGVKVRPRNYLHPRPFSQSLISRYKVFIIFFVSAKLGTPWPREQSVHLSTYLVSSPAY